MRTKPIAAMLSALLLIAGRSPAQDAPRVAAPEAGAQPPEMILDDGSIRLTFGEPLVVLPRGLQPSLLCMRSGALLLQAQVPEKPFPSKRIAYFSAMCTQISRDGGATWTILPLTPGENGLNMEGGAIQTRDGSILALDTYVPPGAKPGEGIGQIYVSTDDWKTVDGPRDALFDIPRAKFDGSSDDGGRPHAAMRAHRRILELPNGDLLTTLYGWLEGDATPATYAPTMMKSRALLVRSSDKGRSWKLVSTIAVDPSVGTEGFGEPVLCRTSKGPNPDRLICLMRTGRNLYAATSEDLGATWSPPREWIVAGLDVNRVELWADHYRNLKDARGKPIDENNLDELRGAAVDPDLIELRSGLLVATFGVRIPQKACWRRPDHPWNGNYLAVSRDHGQTWSAVSRITSGVLTTHYTAIEETPTDDVIYLAYDLGGWSKGMRRDVVGRTVKLERRDGSRP
ncbi:sialidase family protein [Paludisphaera rhizosphaerae]|uniref:sialidase family protein n=1 Tax=Paludisphaera rhizosphaerae TaxID=2711216 RepID=UPI0013E9D375|nr:sialidase family protein [Paludisphaera rhizosphaerae]